MIANFKTAKEIERFNRSNAITLKTGLNQVDDTIGGLDLGQVTIVTGANGSAKSTILNMVALNVIMQGYNVGIFSGELTDKRLMDWIYLQAAGKQHTKLYANSKGNISKFYIVQNYIKDRIDNWLDNKLFVYDNEKGSTIEQVGKSIQDLVLKRPDVKLIILDNLMSVNIGSYGKEKYQAQSDLILDLTQLAKKTNVHIIFVAHPTKVKDFIRKEDISGTSDLSNAVDNIFICHRVTQDFKKRSQEFFGWSNSHPIYSYDNVIEIAKNRELGAIEKLCGFYFETETKRILNNKDEYVHYAWETIGDQKEIENIF